jgi:hypothetical protein
VDLLHRNKLTLLVAGGILSVVLVTSAYGVLTSNSGGPVAAVKMVREDGGSATTSNSWNPVPGALLEVTIPGASGTDVLLARFTAASDCRGADGAGCLVRIVLTPAGGNGTELAPKSGDVFRFDTAPVGNSAGGVDDVIEAHAMERSSSRLPAGTYSVRVDYRVTSNAQFALSQWHFTVERID